MNEAERKVVIEAIRYVDAVVLTSHPKNPDDMSISKDLERISPDVFANGGDRNEKDAADPKSSLHADIQVCERLGIEMVFNLGDKVQSSSWLINKVRKNNVN